MPKPDPYDITSFTSRVPLAHPLALTLTLTSGEEITIAVTRNDRAQVEVRIGAHRSIRITRAETDPIPTNKVSL